MGWWEEILCNRLVNELDLEGRLGGIEDELNLCEYAERTSNTHGKHSTHSKLFNLLEARVRLFDHVVDQGCHRAFEKRLDYGGDLCVYANEV